MSLLLSLVLAAEPGAPAATSAPRLVDSREVEILKMILVSPSEALKQPGRCTLRVTIDPAGAPSSVVPWACPPELHDATGMVMLWRWAPWRLDGTAQAVTFDITLDFPLQATRGPVPAPTASAKTSVEVQDASAPRLVASSDLEPLTRVPLAAPGDYPSLSPVPCALRVSIDAAGAPTSVVPGACPAELHAAAVEGVMQWRWSPMIQDGAAIPVQFDLGVAFAAPVGVEGGVVGGVLGGTGGANLGGPRVVHWSEVQVKKRVTPSYPEAMRDAGVEASCRLRVTIDEKGVPTSAVPTDCPEGFEQSSVDAVMQWRWYPMRVEGVAAPVQFDLRLSYKVS